MSWEINLTKATGEQEQMAGGICWNILQLYRLVTGNQKGKKKAFKKRLIPFIIQCKYLLKG